MSLVAYGSSDESEEEEITPEKTSINIKQKNDALKPVGNKLPLTETKLEPIKVTNKQMPLVTNDISNKSINFNFLPTPMDSLRNDREDKIVEEDDVIPVPKSELYLRAEKPVKKSQGRAKISIPSLSDFQDLDDDEKKETKKIKSSKIGCALLDLLPPLKASNIEKAKSLIPHVLTKKSTNTPIPKKTEIQNKKQINDNKVKVLNSLISYDSNSEDEDEPKESGLDFFSLTTPTKIPDHLLPPCEDLNLPNPVIPVTEKVPEEVPVQKPFTTSFTNLRKDEIITKNKVEIGPKLPVPEQEYNIDTEGNVAIDEKAIEYLCGKRGVKRKNKDFNPSEIIEISGEDIKPDERDWLVKAMTEETAQRPVSQGAGPSSQSKKKHQITYLAHQAKAMELELKNQWSQNKFSRQQTRSKYGF